ncbi:MAG: protein kinase [Planctomycetales bacterium]|nr:protein kinase [Planctomycetales bacterium]
MLPSDDQPLELQVDAALAEYLQKCDAGELPDRDHFLTRHPELREQLAELLSAADWIEQLAGPRLADIAQVHADSPQSFKYHDVSLSTVDCDPKLTIQPFAQMGGGPNCDGPTAEPMRPGRTPSELGTAPPSSDDDTLLQYRAGLSFEVSAPADRAKSRFSQPFLPCQFGDYLLERVLGRGGMGVVYYGRQLQLDRPVAIKMIRAGALASQGEVLRFYAEARSAARLDHPNIVTVYQCGECDGHRFFSMDYVAGEDLAKMIASGPLECKRAARYVRDAARAIQYAHQRGILHRDLKPANVLVDESDQVHITDFGLAKTVGVETGLTASGAALGTPSYMSPEQAAGRIEEQHQATDIYSLGAVLFTLVTGQPPFKGSSVVQTIMHVIHRPAPMARTLRSDLPADLETIIDVCLQKSPERRYTSAGALADDLNRFLAGTPIAARPASRIRRSWYWLLGIPIIGAVLDNRVIEPTEIHRWVQRGLISVAILFLMVWLSVLIPSLGWITNRMPAVVRVAGGIEGGNYDKVACAIADALAQQAKCPAEAVSTVGSSDNSERLERDEVQLGLVQADAMGSPTLAVVAPLYYEAVHILIKQQLPIKKLEDLRGHQILLGSEKSGVRKVARLLLARAGLSLDDVHVDSSSWHGLKTDPTAETAIIVAKIGSADLVELLKTGPYRLLPIADSLQFAMDEPIFHPVLLSEAKYPGSQFPEGGLATVATTAFLAARLDAPPILVQTVLERIFAPAFVEQNGILSAERASHWSGHAWHPTAREFFQSYQGSSVSAQ